MRLVLVILAALIVAGGTGFYVMQGLQASDAPRVVEARGPELKEVYVPAQEIAVGTIITPDRLSTMQVTENAVTGQMVVADDEGAKYLTGSVARQVLPQGVPIARSAIVQPGDRGFLAAVLPKGKRAITIPVNQTAGLSGLALPGDHVDLVLTYTVVPATETAPEVRGAETVISDIRVLAFDQRLGPAGPAEGEDKPEPTPVAQTATLEVTSQQAEMVTLAQTLGTLSLILNSVRDGNDDEAEDGRLAKGEGGPLEPLANTMAPRPRRLTLESDVTSTHKVQVVRGVVANATAAPASAAAPAQPAQ
ncbi:MAG: Flp pilus assembly protein CpaB [Amaricoccus sp.]